MLNNDRFSFSALFLVIFVGTAMYVWAQGSLTPPGAPEPTMKTLDQIYSAASGLIDEREGFTESFIIPQGQSKNMVTVPQGKQFVLLKLYAYQDGSGIDTWTIKVGSKLLLNGAINNNAGITEVSDSNRYVHDFPDRTVVVAPGAIMRAENDVTFSTDLRMTVIGYFRTLPAE